MTKIYKGYLVGNSDCEISLLQYVDDTIFTSDVNVRNVYIIKGILRLFELVSRLRVNIHMSSFGAFGVDGGVVARYASMLSCKKIPIPFVYLGLPIGDNPRKVGI